jgi:hypothetical protein
MTEINWPLSVAVGLLGVALLTSPAWWPLLKRWYRRNRSGQ